MTTAGVKVPNQGWKRNQRIVERVEKVAQLSAAGLTQLQIARQLDVGQATISADLDRNLELTADRILGPTADRLAAKMADLEQRRQTASRLMARANDVSLNKSRFLDTLVKIDELECRLLGLLQPDTIIDLRVQTLVQPIQANASQAWAMLEEAETVIAALLAERDAAVEEARAEGRRQALLAAGELKTLPPHRPSELEIG